MKRKSVPGGSQKKENALTHAQARAFYDRFGKKQDTQAFYENAALDALIAHANFEQAQHVFELGCGTGRLASRLLAQHLPAHATYLGIDLSQTMIDLARQQLTPYTQRAQVTLSDGTIRFPLSDQSIDRVVSTYVLDLFSPTDIRAAFAEAHRVLIPGGKLCLASLATGSTLASRLVCGLWSSLFRLHAPLVGGCRPTQLDHYYDDHNWTVDYCTRVIQFGVPSEVLILRAQ